MGRVYNTHNRVVEFAQYGHAQVEFIERLWNRKPCIQSLRITLPRKVHVRVMRDVNYDHGAWVVEVNDGAGRRWCGDGIDVEVKTQEILDAGVVCNVAHMLGDYDIEWLRGVLELAAEKWPRITEKL